MCGAINYHNYFSAVNNCYWKFKIMKNFKIKFFTWEEKMTTNCYLAHYSNNNLNIFKYVKSYMVNLPLIYSQENLNTVNADSLNKIFTKVAKLNQII
jgi:hypothetical protein